MSFFRAIKVCCFFVLFHQSVYSTPIQAENYQACCQVQPVCCPVAGSHFGTAGFSVTDPNLWYSINTNSYPETTPLSLGRNKGFAEGGVYLSPTGFTIGEAGNYWVSVTAVLENPTENTSVMIPVFLVRDETFDQDDPSALGGAIILDNAGQEINLRTMTGSGILKNVTAGTRLSLVATNSGYEDPVPVTVAAWGISLFKMP